MWLSIANLYKSVAAFLTSNKVPPGTPYFEQHRLRRTNHLTSKKFFITWTSFVGLLFFYFVSIAILFMLPNNQGIISGYITIFTKTIEVVAIIVAAYLGVQAVVDFKYGSSSEVINDSNISVTVHENKIIHEKTIIYAEKFANDPSYAPLDWVFKNEDYDPDTFKKE
jgi:hypothetical protein